MSEEFVPYRAIEVRDQRFIVAGSRPSPETREKVKQVLDFYDVSYTQTDDGELLIPKSLAEDKDTLWNYTTKAGDPEWLTSHRK
jgi:hypothetical protein